MYNIDKVYRSVYYFLAQLCPSGVSMVDGESYGIRLDDPTGKVPAIALTIEEVRDQVRELGSFGSEYSTTITISAKSRLQRDALKSIVYSGLNYQQIPVYSDFVQFTPASGAVVEVNCLVGDKFRIRDMPNFDSDREKFFWNAVVFVTLDTIGV